LPAVAVVPAVVVKAVVVEAVVAALVVVRERAASTQGCRGRWK